MKSKKTAAIVQARMSSTRLPGKILMPLAEKPVLQHIVERLAYCKNIEQIIIATTTSPSDDIVEQFCLNLGVDCFRGDTDDVLDRYYQAAVEFDLDTIVRITADCPAIDPFIVDEVISYFFEGLYDVCSLDGSFPDGLDCTALKFSVLSEAWHNADLPSEREHVVPYLSTRPEQYKVGSYEKFVNLGHHRWTLDEPRDYDLLTTIFTNLYKNDDIFITQDILDLFTTYPEYYNINAGIGRNEGYLKSLEMDKIVRQKE